MKMVRSTPSELHRHFSSVLFLVYLIGIVSSEAYHLTPYQVIRAPQSIVQLTTFQCMYTSCFFYAAFIPKVLTLD